MISSSTSLEESFELLNPLFIATDKAHKQQIYQNIVYDQENSPPSQTSSTFFADFCPLCLSDFLKGMKDTEEKNKLLIKRYDQTMNNDFMNNPSSLQTWNESKRLMKKILELEDTEKEIDVELKSNEQQFSHLDDQLSAICDEIQELETELNCLYQEDELLTEEWNDTLSLIENKQIEIHLLSQTISSKSLFSMTWKKSHLLSSSPPDPAPLAQSTLSSFLASSIPSVFSTTPLALPSTEQKIFSINRMRTTYGPISTRNLNWGEICLGWSMIGTFLQGFLYEMEWISRQISTTTTSTSPTTNKMTFKCTFEMILLRGKVVFRKILKPTDVDYDDGNGNEDKEGHGHENSKSNNNDNDNDNDGFDDKEYSEQEMYRLYCTEEEVESTNKSLFLHDGDRYEDMGSSLEYRQALLCLGITLIEITEFLQDLLQHHWKDSSSSSTSSSSSHAGFGYLQRSTSLEYLKSRSVDRSVAGRRWPSLGSLVQFFPNKVSLIHLVNDILSVVYNLHSLGLARPIPAYLE